MYKLRLTKAHIQTPLDAVVYTFSGGSRRRIKVKMNVVLLFFSKRSVKWKSDLRRNYVSETKGIGIDELIQVVKENLEQGDLRVENGELVGQEISDDIIKEAIAEFFTELVDGPLQDYINERVGQSEMCEYGIESEIFFRENGYYPNSSFELGKFFKENPIEQIVGIAG